MSNNGYGGLIMKVLRLLPVVLLSVASLAGLFLVLRVSAAPSTPTAVIIVDNLDDELNSDDDCSLREATITEWMLVRQGKFSPIRSCSVPVERSH